MAVLPEFGSVDLAMSQARALGTALDCVADGMRARVHPDGTVDPASNGTDLVTTRENPVAYVEPTHGAVSHNFNGSQDEQWAMAAKCAGSDCENASEHINQVLCIKYWYHHRVEITDQDTGEIRECDRVVLISADGEFISFVSAGVMAGLQLIRQFKGDGPYDPAVRVKLKQNLTRSGHTINDLEPVIS